MGGGGDLSPGERRPKRESDKLPPSSTEVKNEWVISPLLPYIYFIVCSSEGTGFKYILYIYVLFTHIIYNILRYIIYNTLNSKYCTY